MLKVLEVAFQQDGYLEKKTNDLRYLYDKTANAGSNNWNKFAHELDKTDIYNGKKNGYAWCDIFVDWCFMTAYGIDKAQQITFQPNGGCGAGCTYSMRYYAWQNRFDKNPQPGDQIFFTNDGGNTSYHTGLVYKVEGNYVYTIEGNTSSAPGVVENGGCVRMKSYPKSATYIAGYGHPDYSLVKDIEDGGDEEMSADQIRKIVQEEMNKAKEQAFYKTYKEVPTIYKPAIQWLNDLGLLTGYDGGADQNTATFGDNTLKVDETFCRLAFVWYNAVQKGLLTVSKK